MNTANGNTFNEDNCILSEEEQQKEWELGLTPKSIEEEIQQELWEQGLTEELIEEDRKLWLEQDMPRCDISAFLRKCGLPEYDCMKGALRWLVWKLEPGADPSKKPNKVPYYTNGVKRHGELDSPEEIKNLASYWEAKKALETGPYDGLAFALGLDHGGGCWQGIDLDNIEENQLSSIANELPGYVEASPSGKGCHAIGYGKSFETIKSGGIEAYCGKRFFTVTEAQTRPSSSADLADFIETNIRPRVKKADHSGAIANFALIEVSPTESNDVILNRARNAKNKVKFNKLWSGDYSDYSSQSEADDALINMLCLYTESNAQVRELFRWSGLGKRDKAERDDYLDRSISHIRQEAAERDSVKFDNLIEQTKANRQEVPSIATVVESELQWPPGFAGTLAQYVYHTSYLPVKEVAVTAAIALLAGVCGRAYRTPTKANLALYMILVGRSGIGKEGLREGITSLIEQISDLRARQFVRAIDYASGQALHKDILNGPGFLNIQGEFGRRLKLIANPANQPMQTFRTVLTKAYGSNGLDGLSYSDADKNCQTVFNPALSFVGETTPDTFLSCLSSDMMEDGFLSRFLIVNCSADRPESNKDCNHKLLPEDLGHWNEIVSAAIPYQEVINCPEAIAVDSEPNATAILDRYEIRCAAEINGNNQEAIRQAWNRAHLKAVKIASLLAAAENPLFPKITTVQAQWAVDFINRDINTFLQREEAGDIGTGDDSRQKKLIDLLKKYIASPATKGNEQLHTDGVVSRRWLQQKIANISIFKNHPLGATKAFESALGDLIKNGFLEELPKSTSSEKYKVSGQHYLIVY